MSNNLDWYFSQEGVNAYSQQDSLDKRTQFLYSYLNKISSPGFLKSGVLFKIAFFFADGVSESTLPYASYPEIINDSKNPFLKYLIKGDFCSEKALYHVFMSILHCVVDVADDSSWIYDRDSLRTGMYKTKLIIDNHDVSSEFPDYKIFSVEQKLQFMQLQLIWLFGQEGKK